MFMQNKVFRCCATCAGSSGFGIAGLGLGRRSQGEGRRIKCRESKNNPATAIPGNTTKSAADTSLLQGWKFERIKRSQKHNSWTIPGCTQKMYLERQPYHNADFGSKLKFSPNPSCFDHRPLSPQHHNLQNSQKLPVQILLSLIHLLDL